MKRSSQITLIYSKDEIAAILAKNIQTTQNVTITSFTYDPEDKIFTFVGEEGASEKSIPQLSTEIEKIFTPVTAAKKKYRPRSEGPTATIRTLMSEGHLYPIDRLLQDVTDLGVHDVKIGNVKQILTYLNCKEMQPGVWQMQVEQTKEII